MMLDRLVTRFLVLTDVENKFATKSDRKRVAEVDRVRLRD